MHFDEIIAPTMKDLFVRRLEDMILSGVLPVGCKLPSERELAEQMKVSKTVVHSGIVELQRRGFLTVQPRRGMTVADYVENGNLETLTSIMEFNGGKLDRKNSASILEVRLDIEVPAIRKAARRCRAEDAARLQEIVASAEQAVSAEPPDIHELAMQHYRFHHEICVISGNTISPLIFNAFKSVTLPFWERELYRVGTKAGAQRLRELFELVTSGDEDGSAAYLERIIAGHMPEH